MTEKEKAKAYDDALKKASISYKDEDKHLKATLERIFPELKESEDEKIRKEIISILRNAYWTSNKNRFNELVAWLENQRDKDKLIQELGEYKVKYTQEVLEKYINSTSNKDDERLRKTAIAFLKDFAEQGYENAVECIDWLEKQGEQEEPQVYETEDGNIITYSETDGYKFVEPNFHENERAWLYLVSDVLTWKDGIGQYLDDPEVQELAKRLCSEYSQKLYYPSVRSNSSNAGKNKQKTC